MSITRIKNPKEINISIKGYCENFFKEITNSNIIFTNSATSALFNTIRALNLKDNEIIIPSYAHPAVRNCLYTLNIKPIFAKNKNLVIDTKDVISKISDNTKAIVYCEINGYIDDGILKLRDICNKRNIILIEDSAPSLCQKINSINAGSIGDISVFSFSSSKLFYLGGGGICAVKDKSIFEKIKRYTELSDYKNFEDGVITTYLSSLLYPILKDYIDNFDELVQIRENNFKLYKENTKYILDTGASGCYGAASFILDEANISKLEKQLKLFKIEYRSKVYPEYQYNNIRDKHIDLPFHNDLTEKEIKLICNILNKVIK